MRLKPILFFLVVGGVVAFLVFRHPASNLIAIGQRAPDFTVKDSAGKELRLNDLRGKLVFLNFWASWCVPCDAEMPYLERMNTEFKDRNFQMVAISVDARENDARKFYDDRRLTLPWFWDPGRQVAERYNVNQYPETFIINSKGNVIKHYPGPVTTQIMAQIQNYLRESEAAESPVSQ